jgi:hypothetical protein
VSEEAASQRIAVIWSPEASADLRAIDREIAMQILHGDHRVFFNLGDDNVMEITGVRNRREAYR